MRYIFLIFCFLLVFNLHAREYTIERLGLEQGLSNNYIMGITQDKDGFIWFSTESGLNRFDGNNFRVYRKNNPKEEFKTISGNELNAVYADKFDDIIWIATQRDGLNAFDPKTETFKHYKYNFRDSLSIITNDVTNIVNSKDGNLWISTYHFGFDYFDKKTGAFTHYNQSTLPGLVSNGIWSIAEDKSGLLYIGHVNAGLSIFSPTDNKIKNYRNIKGDPESLPGNTVNAIFIDNSDNIWVGTDMGLALFNVNTETFTVFKHNPLNDNSLISSYICSITQLDDGSLWIGTENGGISILNLQQSMFLSPQNIQFSNLIPGDDRYSLSNQTIRKIFQDSFKNIWIGTYGGGINFISHIKPFFQTWSYSPIAGIPNSLNNKIAWGICADAENRIWIGTDGGGIDVFENGKKVKSFNKDNSNISDNSVIAAFKDSKNNLWFGTFYGGVNIYNYKDKRLYPLYLNNVLDIRCFSEDKNGNIWIGSSNGIHIYNLEKGFVKLYTKENSQLRDNLVRSICHDKEGDIWVGFFGEGLARYNQDMELIEYFYVKRGLNSNMINYIMEDTKGNIWIGTGEGLVCFRAGTDRLNPVIFNEDNGLNDSHVRAIAEDENNNIWISTTSGISRYETRGNKFYNYNHYDGIPLGGFMSGSVTETSDNVLYFGSQNGVCYFDPNVKPVELNLPAVVITDFKIYDNKVELSEGEIHVPVESTIKLNYSQNTFEISFNILDYSVNHLTEYSYMLKGLEDSWYSSQNGNSITFRNIPHGSYELLIRSKIRNQEWSDNVTSLDIKIMPPIWLTWWAKTIYGVIAILIIFGLMRFYKHKLQLENSLILEKRNHQQEQELNNERLRFFTNITHELRTPLTLILGPLEDLTVDKSLPEKHASKISVIYKSATRLLNLINQILEFRKTETQNKKLTVRKDNLEKLITEIGLKYKELNIKENVSFETLVEEGDYQVYYDPDVITTILENLISNAFKYTEEGKINLILRNVEKENILYTEIEVKDTGRGIHPDSISRIFDRYYQEKSGFQGSGTGIGLALVQNLVALHQGSIFVDSELDEGTTFRFSISNNNEYPYAIRSNVEKPMSAVSDSDSENKEIFPVKESKQIVLVVEDNEEINNYIVTSLSETYKVYSAVNGKEGLDKAQKYIPDIIISDIMMPEMDGYELTKIIKEDVRTSHIPVILLTAKDTIQDRTEGYSIGAESYITKPFSAGLLQSRILNLMESKRKLAEQLRNTNTNKAELIAESLNNLDKEFIEKITSIIEENIDSERLDVNFIADKMFMSHSTLYRKIKALTEMTANEFIRKIRIRKAEQLLLTGKYTVSEISYMVGMNSITYFRQCFKEEFNMVPSEYIKKIKDNS